MKSSKYWKISKTKKIMGYDFVVEISTFSIHCNTATNFGELTNEKYPFFKKYDILHLQKTDALCHRQFDLFEENFI